MSASDRLRSLRDQLASLTYDLAAVDMIRFRADPNDDAVAGVVRSVTAEGDLAGDDFRSSLDAPQVDTLRLFATRRVLQARRQSSVSAVYESLDAFALLPALNDVPWDTWVRADLVVARSIGGDPGSIQDRFDDVAGDRAAKRFGVVLESMDRVDDLAQCGITEVRTTYGIGFVETLVFRDRHSMAILSASAPRQADRAISYTPASNLAQLAVDLADAVDAAGHATSSPIGPDQLAASLFSLVVPGSYIATTGCLSFIAESTEDAPSVSVLLAELPDDVDADSLAQAARESDGQAATYDGQRLIVASPQPRFDDVVETSADLSELEGLARRALADPATL